jgi:superfamily II DNA or RNA helicase
MKIVIRNNLRLPDPPAALKEALIEKLTIPNPKWLENQRMGRWNRGTPKELRYYDKVRGGLWLPRGFMRQLILLCRRMEIETAIEDQRRCLPPVSLTFSGTLKPFQQTAVEKMLARDFGTLSAPTGSGKTVMALYMIAARRQPALIVVHTRELALQWVERISTFLGFPEEEVGLVGGGKKRVSPVITVALVQSLYKCADEVSESIGHLIVDECHRTPSRTFTDAVTEFDARYMLGLSATPWRRDKLSRLIFWHLGDVHHEVGKQKLIDSGDVLDTEVIIRNTEFKPFFDPVNQYSKMLSELTADDDRNRLIAADVAEEAATAKGVLLVLSDRKKHCETLQALLKYRHACEATLLTGDVPTPERRDVLTALNSGEIKVLIATGQLIGEGFDCRDLATLFITTPVRFSGRLLQYLGRVLRPAPGKSKARVFDYVDVLVEPLLASARARQRVYDGLE